MMETIGFILSPIVWAMRQVLDLYFGLTGSMGLSIILVSFTFSLLLVPLQRWGVGVEQRLATKLQDMDEKLRPLKQELKGEELFHATEKVYKEHGYHPIHNIAMGTSFLVMLPVLLSAIFLFAGTDTLAGSSFLFVSDLSQPDGLLGPINLLPFVMFGVTVVDARMRFAGDSKSQTRFYIISVVLLVLVYNLAAGLVLYWTSSNVMSLFMSWIRRR